MIDTASPFSISAAKDFPAGYSVPFCYKCQITPTGLAPIEITKFTITVTANPLECSGSLIDASFLNPPVINYDSTTTTTKVVSGYTEIFT